jgi:hypothetical protein
MVSLRVLRMFAFIDVLVYKKCVPTYILLSIDVNIKLEEKDSICCTDVEKVKRSSLT